MTIDFDKAGRSPTRKHFKEFSPDGKDTLARWHDVFVDQCDPTEYSAAIALLGSWPRWQRFKREWPSFANKILPVWLEEVEIKLRSKAIKDLFDVSHKQVQAAKFLADGKYLPREKADMRKTENKVRETKIREHVKKETNDEVSRVVNFVGNK